MKRSPMPRGSGFKRPEWTPAPKAPLRPVEPRLGVSMSLRIADGDARMTVPVPKREYVRSEKLMRAYRSIPCQLCFVMDGTVCGAHSNSQSDGKAMGKKASDDRCASLCHSCHAELDQGKRDSKAEKRRLWLMAHGRTVNALLMAGAWPEGVPLPSLLIAEDIT